MDFFKKINDNFGHQVGDTTLKAITSLIQKIIRKSDTLFRWGGEEFTIICAHTNSNGALKLAEKIRQEIEVHKFNGIGKQTASLGISIAKKEDSIEAFVKRCDDSLYMAKSLGRNQIKMI